MGAYETAKILEAIHDLKHSVIERFRRLMGRFAESEELLKAIDDSTTKMGNRLADLASQVKAGMSPSEADQLKADLQKVADHSKAIASDPENPVPTPPPDSG